MNENLILKNIHIPNPLFISVVFRLKQNHHPVI